MNKNKIRSIKTAAKGYAFIGINLIGVLNILDNTFNIQFYNQYFKMGLFKRNKRNQINRIIKLY